VVNLAKEIGVVQDKGARSLSYYCTETAVGIDQEVIDQLLEVSVQNGNCDARISLHTSPDDNFHEMIILQHRGRYFRPHRHTNKGESCHIIRGTVAFFVFNDDGSIAESSVVGENGGMLFRSGPDLWHTVIPISDYAVYHESKPGPYLNQNDSIYPDWAPDGNSADEAAAYMTKLLSMVPSAN